MKNDQLKPIEGKSVAPHLTLDKKLLSKGIVSLDARRGVDAEVVADKAEVIGQRVTEIISQFKGLRSKRKY